MSNETEKFTKQLEAAREITDRHPAALAALGRNEDAHVSAEFQGQLDVARERMKKYHAVYRALSE